MMDPPVNQSGGWWKAKRAHSNDGCETDPRSVEEDGAWRRVYQTSMPSAFSMPKTPGRRKRREKMGIRTAAVKRAGRPRISTSLAAVKAPMRRSIKPILISSTIQTPAKNHPRKKKKSVSVKNEITAKRMDQAATRCTRLSLATSANLAGVIFMSVENSLSVERPPGRM